MFNTDDDDFPISDGAINALVWIVLTVFVAVAAVLLYGAVLAIHKYLGGC